MAKIVASYLSNLVKASEDEDKALTMANLANVKTEDLIAVGVSPEKLTADLLEVVEEANLKEVLNSDDVITMIRNGSTDWQALGEVVRASLEERGYPAAVVQSISLDFRKAVRRSALGLPPEHQTPSPEPEPHGGGGEHQLTGDQLQTAAAMLRDGMLRGSPLGNLIQSNATAMGLPIQEYLRQETRRLGAPYEW